MGVFSLAGWSPLFQTGFHVSRPTQDTAIRCRTYLYRTITVYGSTFQRILIHGQLHIAVLQPRSCRNTAGLGYSPFARRYSGNRVFFLFLRLLRCFSSAGWLSIYIERRPFRPPGCPIRISPDQFSLADPRSFSQLYTSFIASISLGIPRTPVHTFFTFHPEDCLTATSETTH